LPEPEGPTRATISPGWIASSMPRSTSIVTSPCVKLRFSSRVTRIASLIAQYLDRIGACRLVRRVEGREERQDKGGQDDNGDLHRIGLGRQISQEAHLRIPQILARDRLDAVHDILAEVEEDGAEDDAQGSEEHTSEFQSLAYLV